MNIFKRSSNKIYLKSRSNVWLHLGQHFEKLGVFLFQHYHCHCYPVSTFFALQDIARTLDTVHMERCVLIHDRCDVVFYHNGLESDELFEGGVSNTTTKIEKLRPVVVARLRPVVVARLRPVVVVSSCGKWLWYS